MAEYPENRHRVEDAYGLDYCKRVYPELYQVRVAEEIDGMGLAWIEGPSGGPR